MEEALDLSFDRLLMMMMMMMMYDDDDDDVSQIVRQKIIMCIQTKKMYLYRC